MCQPGTPRLGRHFNNRLPLVVNAVLAPDRPITLFRLWRCDDAYRMTAGEARTAPPRRELAGAGQAVARVETQGRSKSVVRVVGRWLQERPGGGFPVLLGLFGQAEPVVGLDEFRHILVLDRERFPMRGTV